MNNVTWDYQGERGPEMWGHLCPEFKIADHGKEQSPIDIKESDVERISGEALVFSYTKDTYTVKRVENSVHAFPTNLEQGLTYRGTFYRLVAFHAHIPSEHLLNGESKPIEWHFVHENEAAEKLVLGVWMEFGKDWNEKLQALASNFKAVFPDFDKQETIALSIEDFLPKQRAFYQYHGSLTTPPTVENVTWIILKEPSVIAADIHADFETTIGATNRPIQPLHSRRVYDVE